MTSNDSRASIAKFSPEISFDPRNRRQDYRNFSEKEILDGYFETQNADYVKEIDSWISLTNPMEDCTVGIVVPAKGEKASFFHCAKLLEAVQRKTDFVLPLFVLNRTNGDRFEKLHASQAIGLRGQFPKFVCLEKEFGVEQASLGRARKYGCDFFLRLFHQREVESGIILFLEADMRSCIPTIVSDYLNKFRSTGAELLQGKVNYPSVFAQSSSFHAFWEAQQSAILGLGRHVDEFPNAFGTLLVARNFAVTARLAAAANSFDPRPVRGAEDDLVFGMDVSIVGGDGCKTNCNIAISTDPRRELGRLKAFWDQRESSLKASYSYNFDPDREEMEGVYNEEMLKEIILLEKDVGWKYTDLSEGQVQWLARSLFKERLISSGERFLVDGYRSHLLSYWEMEDGFYARMCETLSYEQVLDLQDRAREMLEQFVREYRAIDEKFMQRKNQNLS